MLAPSQSCRMLCSSICSGTCNNHIGMGVRYNAEKKKIGAYHSTPIFSFRCKCHLCDGWFEIQTDPKVWSHHNTLTYRLPTSRPPEHPLHCSVWCTTER